MKTRFALVLILGIWLGGSVLMAAVVSYNFGGFEDLFDRNPALAAQAGFDPSDIDAKKTSLLWVHASELNRVFFHAWNRAQLILALLAVTLAVAVRARWVPIALLTLALVLVALIHFGIEPQVVDLGRQLDFLPRSPTPAIMVPFQRLHGLYFGAELARLCVLVMATLLLILGGIPLSPDFFSRESGASR